MRLGWRILFWVAVLFAFTMAAMPHPPEVPIVKNDKLQHAMAFAVLTVLGRIAYPRIGIVKLALGLLGLAALIEVVQAIPELHRDADIYDWYAGGTAVLAVVVLALLWQRLAAR